MTESSQQTSPGTGTTPSPQTTPPNPSETTPSTIDRSLLDPPEPTAKPEPGKTEAKPEPGKEGDKGKPIGAPETYADFTVPDGYTLDKAAATDAQALFKELGLTQDQAQKTIDLYAKHAIESQNESLKSFRETRDGWVAEAKKQFGTAIEPGGKVLTDVGRMLDSLGDTKLVGEFKSLMNLTGAGDHPAFIGVLAKLAERFSEGTSVPGGKASPFGQGNQGQGRKSAAAEMYPNLPSGG